MQLTSHCYAVLGLACEPPWTVNAGLIVGDTHTLIVDTGTSASAAATIHGYASAIRPGNVLRVVDTEQHLDHIGGNAYLRDLGIDIYGHAAIARTEQDLAANVDDYNACITNPVRRQQREGMIAFAGTRIANPTQRISADTTWDLGHLTVQLVLTPGHTPSNLSVWVPAEGVAYCGDCVVGDYIPNLEGGAENEWRVWLDSLERLRALAPSVLVPGHGRVLRGPEIEREIQRVRRALEEALASGRAPTA